MEILEKKTLSKMSSATLLGKLQEHEIELERLQMHEDNQKKSQTITTQAFLGLIGSTELAGYALVITVLLRFITGILFTLFSHTFVI